MQHSIFGSIPKNKFSCALLLICGAVLLVGSLFGRLKQDQTGGAIINDSADKFETFRGLRRCEGFNDDWDDDSYDDCRPEPSPHPTPRPTRTPTFSPSASMPPSAPPSRSADPTSSAKPSAQPSISEMPSVSVRPSVAILTYVPGELTRLENGLRLSTGLRSRLIASTGKKVRYRNGKTSPLPFHDRPDGAQVFTDPRTGGWVYVSNSEEPSGRGGVGAIRFDKDGHVTDYYMILTKTSRNCQGGKTPWNTWVSCEENDSKGQCWETDPFGRRDGRRTYLGGDGGNFEAVACDNRNSSKLVFFVTNDDKEGEVRRFTPDATVVNAALNGGDHWNILGTPGRLDYLVIEPDGKDEKTGSFSWSSDLRLGKRSARRYFQKCEGIDFVDGRLYFVSSRQKELFVLDTDTGRYRRTSTETNGFDGEPDSLMRNYDILYIAEEEDYSGIYGRDNQGKMFTMLRSEELVGDTSGLAFSPDNKKMYVAIQRAGRLFEITREDGKAFNARVLDLSYHEKKD